MIGLITLGLVAAGLFLRLRNTFTHPPLFWLDEAFWAMRVADEPLANVSIRPLGFMAVSKLMAHWFGLTEPALRALPVLAGVLTAAGSPFLARVLFRSERARLFFVAILCLHPVAIDFTNEFKPYSLSLAWHLALLFLAALYWQSDRRRRLVAALAVAAPASLFCQDIIFAYPGFFLALALCAYNRRDRRALLWVGGGACFTLGLLLVQYWFLWRLAGSGAEAYWGERYGVFYLQGPDSPSYLGWLAEKYRELTGFPGYRQSLWRERGEKALSLREFKRIEPVIWFILHGLGLATILARRLRFEALMLVLPLLLVVAFNALGVWPFGAFRTNLFLLAYFAALAALALDGSPTPAAQPWRLLLASLPALLFIVLPMVYFEHRWHTQKGYMTTASPFRENVEALAKNASEAPGPLHIVADQSTCFVFRYYLSYHPKRESRGRKLGNYTLRCSDDEADLKTVLKRALAREPRSAWVFTWEPRVLRRARRSWLRGCDVRRVAVVRRVSLVHVSCPAK